MEKLQGSKVWYHFQRADMYGVATITRVCEMGDGMPISLHILKPCKIIDYKWGDDSQGSFELCQRMLEELVIPEVAARLALTFCRLYFENEKKNEFGLSKTALRAMLKTVVIQDGFDIKKEHIVG